MNHSSDLSALSSPEQQQHSFNFSSPVASFNPLPSTPQFAYNPCWYSSELSPNNTQLSQHSTPSGSTDVYHSYTPPQSYMTNNAVSYQQPHWYTNNTGHHQQQYQPQQQYFHRQSQYHPYRRSSQAVITNRVC